MAAKKSKKGQLLIVGSGIKGIAQCTMEARREIECADIVFTLVPDPVGMAWIRQLNNNVHTLDQLYQQEENRWQTYQAMIGTLLDAVRQELRVVAVFYGHPGVFVYPSHEAITQARREGFIARMQPGISAEDCLFADLGVDPAEVGCQSHEASAFLIWPVVFDPRCSLVLWQIGVTGDLSLNRATPLPGALALLTQKLLTHYPPKHRIALYECATLDVHQPMIQWLRLEQLPSAKPSHVATLYIPPFGDITPDMNVVKQLGLPADNLYFTVAE